MKSAGGAVEEFVHQFGGLHLRGVDDDFLAGSGHPAGLGMGAATRGGAEVAAGAFSGGFCMAEELLPFLLE